MKHKVVIFFTVAQDHITGYCTEQSVVRVTECTLTYLITARHAFCFIFYLLSNLIKICVDLVLSMQKLSEFLCSNNFCKKSKQLLLNILHYRLEKPYIYKCYMPEQAKLTNVCQIVNLL